MPGRGSCNGWWLCVLGSCLGCSAPTESTRSLQQDLAGGTIDPDTHQVYALHVSAPNPLLCSATLVAPNLLLTARHCVSTSATSSVVCGSAPLGELVEVEHVRVNNVLSSLDAPPDPAVDLEITRFEIPPGSDDVCGHDLAALLLAESVPNVPPLPPRLDLAPEVGERYTAVGYGQLTTKSGSRAGVRLRLSDREILCVGGCEGETMPSEFSGSDGVCLGDSGGPAIDEAGRVFGIASRSAEGCARPSYSSLPAFADWLDPLLDEAALAGGYDRPGEVEPDDPEPEPDEPEPEPEPGRSGDRCSTPEPCASELVCFYENSPDDARCRERCHEDADCGSRERCDAELEVCRVPPAAQATDGCAVHPGSQRGTAWWMLLGLFGLRRRRRGEVRR